MTTDVTFSRTPAALLAAVGLLAVLTAWFGVRVLMFEAAASPTTRGVYTNAEDAERVQRLLSRMAKALVAMQTSDGGFYAGSEEVGQQGVHERLASSALASAALARMVDAGIVVEGLDLRAHLGRAVAHLVKHQADSGGIGKLAVGPEQRYFQIDATSAALYAFVTVGDVASIKAAKRAAPALAGFAKDGLRNGWPRALAAMAVHRVYRARRQALFPRNVGRVVKGRQVSDKDQIDFRVTEAIVRRVLQPGSAAVDAFPGQVLATLRQEPLFWKTMQSDVQLWWMQTWLVARGADSGAWFGALLRTLEDEAILADGRLPGGYFADQLVQTAAGVLAILEGIDAGS